MMHGHKQVLRAPDTESAAADDREPTAAERWPDAAFPMGPPIASRHLLMLLALLKRVMLWVHTFRHLWVVVPVGK